MKFLFFLKAILKHVTTLTMRHFKFFKNATVIVKEFDLLQPAKVSVFLSLFPRLKFYASLQKKAKNIQKVEMEVSGCSWTFV